jgi:hypothetical protein
MHPSQHREIDHFNRIRTDNRRENLREVTKKEQNNHHSKKSSNKTGYTGISRTGNSFRVTWRENGKQRQESFSFKKYGGEHRALNASRRRRKEICKEIGNTNGLKVDSDLNVIEDAVSSESSSTNNTGEEEESEEEPAVTNKRKSESDEESSSEPDQNTKKKSKVT